MEQLILKSMMVNRTNPQAAHVSHIRKWTWDDGSMGPHYKTWIRPNIDIVSEIYLTNWKYHNVKSISITADDEYIYEVPFIFFELYTYLNNDFAAKFKSGYIPLLFEQFFGHKLYLCAIRYVKLEINVDTCDIQPPNPTTNFDINTSDLSSAPLEIWDHIMNLCDIPTWGNLRKTCKLLYSLPTNHNVQDRFNIKMSALTPPTLRANEVLLEESKSRFYRKENFNIGISSIDYKKIVLQDNQLLTHIH